MPFFVGDQKHPLFGTSAFDFIVLDYELLFKNFDGVQFLRCLCLGEHDFAKIALSEDGEEVEVIETNATTGTLRVCRWRDFLWLLLLYLLQSLLMLLRFGLRRLLYLWRQSALTIHWLLLWLILRLLLTIRLSRISADIGIGGRVVLWLLLTPCSIPIVSTRGAISTRGSSPWTSSVVYGCSLIRWRCLARGRLFTGKRSSSSCRGR